MEEGKNGFVCNLNEKEFADNILKVIETDKTIKDGGEDRGRNMSKGMSKDIGEDIGGGMVISMVISNDMSKDMDKDKNKVMNKDRGRVMSKECKVMAGDYDWGKIINKFENAYNGK